MYSQVASELRQRAELLLRGQIEQLVNQFVFPLPVFLQSTRLVITSPGQARVIFSHLQLALAERGVVMLRPTISAIDLPRAGRFRVWVDWHETTVPAEATRMSQVVYYCRMTDLGLQTEMLDYTHLSMPELNPQIAALALSA